MQSSVVNFSLTQTTCNFNYGSFFQLYMDWNQDGDWLDVGEQVYSQGASVNGNQTVTGSFTVPAGATVGITRMRVVHVEASASTTNYAHTAYYYGETEDYCFTVTQSIAPTITSIPSSGCPGVPISISGTNFMGATVVQFGGINAASFSVVNSSTILAIPTANATGTITVTSGSGSGSSSTIFTILPQPATPTLTASHNQLCGTGGTIALSASGGSGTYLWNSSLGSPGLSSTSGTNITAAITQTSSIQLTATTTG